MPTRTTVRLQPDLLRAAKKKAAEDGRTLTSLIEEGLRAVVEKKSNVARPRVPVRISTARGGVQPGVDLTRTSDLLEDLDEELPIEKRR